MTVPPLVRRLLRGLLAGLLRFSKWAHDHKDAVSVVGTAGTLVALGLGLRTYQRGQEVEAARWRAHISVRASRTIDIALGGSAAGSASAGAVLTIQTSGGGAPPGAATPKAKRERAGGPSASPGPTAATVALEPIGATGSVGGAPAEPGSALRPGESIQLRDSLDVEVIHAPSPGGASPAKRAPRAAAPRAAPQAPAIAPGVGSAGGSLAAATGQAVAGGRETETIHLLFRNTSFRPAAILSVKVRRGDGSEGRPAGRPDLPALDLPLPIGPWEIKRLSFDGAGLGPPAVIVIEDGDGGPAVEIPVGDAKRWGLWVDFP